MSELKLLTFDIEKLAKENGARDDTLLNDINDCTYIVFDSTESLTKFAEAYAAKALEDKEREIAALNNAVQDALLSSRECRRKLVEQGIYSNDLRDALIEISYSHDGYARKKAKQALSKTPAQSLQGFENEVIDRCANDLDRQGFNHAGDAIRALKG